MLLSHCTFDMELTDLIFHRRPTRFMNIAMLYAIQNGRCGYCGKYMLFRPHRRPGDQGYTVDHFFPHSKGFIRAGNCLLACRKCNEMKGNLIPELGTILAVMKMYARFNLTFICHGFSKKMSGKLKKHGIKFRREHHYNQTSLVPIFDFDND
jgi:CRISPR/Cas system Type II protein with McrA/HNH and RuvC-like nuclease domain